MRYPLRFAVLAPFLIVGCQDGNGPLAIDVAYQLTCAGTPNTACTPATIAGANWDYVADDGAEVVDDNGNSLGTAQIRCSATSVADNVLQLALRTELGEDYLELNGFRIARDTGAFVGGACRVSVGDSGTLYGGSTHGACSAATPTITTPCQVVTSSIDRDAKDGPSIDIRLLCNTLPNSQEPSRQVSVRDSQSTGTPAIIRVQNCSGL